MRSGARPVARGAAGALVALLGGAAASGACTQEPQNVPLRSLERSGRAAFLCLAAPGAGSPGRELSACEGVVADDRTSFTDADGNVIPHLYGLVTQTTRGEVAVVDLSVGDTLTAVVDQDTRVPGNNFLAVGAQPTDIVASLGGTAGFVAVAEVGRQGIFALPSTLLRPEDRASVPRLSSWPACSLPSAPGAVFLLPDPPDAAGDVRATCDGPYSANDAADHPNGDLSSEGHGRPKLVVALPDEGGLVVLDAQAILDRPSGSFAPCDIERWVPLSTAIPAAGPPSPEPAGATCVNPEQPPPVAAQDYVSRPAGMAVADGKLYVADTQAPLIHVLDVATPCSPLQLDPLLPTSVTDPARVVTTSRVAVSRGLTPDAKRFAYAVDDKDGSAMVFDISDGPKVRTPVVRPRADLDPFLPRDRVRFSSPVRDIAIVERDVPAQIPASGVAQTGVRCDPDPSKTCPTNPGPTDHCDVEALYRTDTDSYTSGAGPYKLRGTFAFLLLSSGLIAVIDVDDLDAACRGPVDHAPLFGCDDDAEKLVSSAEYSCRVVEPHTPRDSVYVIDADAAGNHGPGLTVFPLLFDKNGSLISPDDATQPRMRATLPKVGAGETAPTLDVSIGGNKEPIASDTGLATKDDQVRHTLVMNLEDPRAHIVDQPWTVTYEGALPGFSQKLAELRLGGADDGLFDASSRFCEAGVMSEEALRFSEPGLSDGQARALADRAQITSELPSEKNEYWKASSTSCSFLQCKSVFGTADVPKPQRELRIVEAYQDHVTLADSDAKDVSDGLVKCCFPSAVGFAVRAGHQWVAVGEGTGFHHHVAADPASGACRPSCDPVLARLNGRIRTSKGAGPVTDGDPLAFQNPMFRFAITECTSDDVCDPLPADKLRGMQFRFVTVGSFQPLLVNLAVDTSDVQPQAMTLVPPTGELAITDGSLEGVLMVSPGSLAVGRQYR